MLDSRKGISPILATLLLIVIAVAAVIVTYAWVMTYTTSTTGQAGVFLRKDSVAWNSTAGTITIYVRNTGTADAEIDAVYVGTSSTNLEKQTSVTYNPSTKLVEKNGGTITITITYSWTSKTTYHFKIAPKVGEPLSFQEAAP
jgi:flagellin-like protein